MHFVSSFFLNERNITISFLMIRLRILTGRKHPQIVGNKAKGLITKRVFQESKARHNFRKTNISYPPNTHTYVCVSGGKKCLFFRNFGKLCFIETPVLRFALLPDSRRNPTPTLSKSMNMDIWVAATSNQLIIRSS